MIERIKQNTDIVEVIERYTELIGNGNSMKARTNPLRDEKTSSFFVYANTQKWHDFGTDEGGDVIDFVAKIEGLSSIDAMKLLDTNANGYELTSTPIATSKPVYVEPIRKDISESLARYAKDRESMTFKNEAYKSEALAIAPLYVYREASKQALKAFKSLTEWDSSLNTILLKISDYDGNVFSTKHRRKNDIKWCTATGTKPNSQCLINITAPKINPIYVIEGHHDFLTAVLLSYDEVESFNCLMIPTVNYKEFTGYELDVLRGKDVYFLPDLKRGDRRGVDAMRTLQTQLDGIANNTRIVNLDAFLAEWGLVVEGDKLDLSEAVELWNDTARAFTNALQFYCDKGIYFEGEIF